MPYPPTHTYRLVPLQPLGVLAERLKILNATVPDFFKADRFLEVGCSKGFFCLHAAHTSEHVVGIEPMEVCAKLCKDIVAECGYKNVTVQQADFLEWHNPRRTRFDRIHLGNVYHYIFNKSKGWGWVEKLARLCAPGGVVVIEGAKGMECVPDMPRCILPELQETFTHELFLAAMAPGFRLRTIVPAVSYTPNRFVMVFDRVANL